MSVAERVRTAADVEGWAARAARSVTFAGPDPHYGIGLDRVLPDFGILCFDETPAAALLRDEAVDVLALGASSHVEDHGRGDAAADEPTGAARGDPRGTPALMRSPRALTWLRERSVRAGGDLPLLVFKPSHQLEQTAHAEGWRLLCSSAALARRWENKVAFRGLAASLGLVQPPGRIVARAAMNYDVLAADLGPTLVVQAPYGYAGMQSYVVSSSSEIDHALASARSPEWRVTGLVAGTPLSINACVTARGVAVGAPFLQLTGLERITPYRLGSCGQDWAIMAHMDVATPALSAAARAIGRALAADGFRGVFGVDFVQGDDGRVYVIEVNPRLIASIALCTQLELADGRLPLLARHVIAHLDPDADQAPMDANEAPLCGGQVVMHNIDHAPFAVADDVRTGAWPVRGHGTTAAGVGPARPAVRTDGLSPDEVLVLMPAPGRSIEHGAAHARLLRRGHGVAERDGRLSDDIGELVRTVCGAVGATPPTATAAVSGDAAR